jgi:TRAP-type mannitol/chloroaromatic compound transport system permease large subunit
MRKELYFGFSLMALILLTIAIFMPWSAMSNGHYGLLMLALVVVAIMLGFPTAFTLMGMGIIFAFFAYHSQGQTASGAIKQVLDLMVQRAYAVMTNDVLISIPLFVFMGYLVERANLIEKLFKSLHLSLARVPGSLAVATIFTCAVFATATGIVGAVVTLMGLLALPAMIKSGYDIRVAAGAITAGGCLGILIPPSVMLILYGATAGVSVVKLYAGAFFPGLMLAGLYIVYVIVLAKFKPHLMPPLTPEQRVVPLSDTIQKLKISFGDRMVPAIMNGLKGARNANLSTLAVFQHALVALLPLIFVGSMLGLLYRSATSVPTVESTEGLVEMGNGNEAAKVPNAVAEPVASGGLQEPPSATDGVKEPTADGVQEPPKEVSTTPATPSAPVTQPPSAGAVQALPAVTEKAVTPAVDAVKVSASNAVTPSVSATDTSLPVPTWFWIVLAMSLIGLAGFYLVLNAARLEIFKMLLSSFFPLAFMILAVLGTIVFGLATPTEAAAVGAAGGILLAAAYRQLNFGVVQESVYLTAKTSAMVCWLFVGSSIFSAAFALLGGQELIENWVVSLGLTQLQFLILSQAIIFVLGWPLEWTEIIVIFMPIFIPLLDRFGVDPLFFGLLVALNLQTAFLSPPVAMAAFYLKGVAPAHVTLNQIFAGMMPFMVIQVIALVLLYTFPGIGTWLPNYLYK